MFDVLVFGATGFTGQFVAIEAIRTLHGKRGSRIALASRDSKKMQDVIRTTIAPALQLSVEEVNGRVGILQADVQDYNSVVAAVKQAKLVINCVGPFRLYGESVVKACVEVGASYLDICGEPEFIETMELRYDEEAKQKGIVIISASGFDSVPADVGCMAAVKELMKRGAVPSQVESFLTLSNLSEGCGNFATYESAILGLSSEDSLSKVREELTKRRKVKKAPLDPRFPRLDRATAVSGTWNSFTKTYIVPFPGSDASVVRRTQLLLAADDSNAVHPPIQYAAYATIGATKSAGYKFILYGGLVKLLSSFNAGKSLLLNHAGWFTNGFFAERGKNPGEAERGVRWRMQIVAKGTKEEVLNAPNASYSKTKPAPLDTSVTLTLEGVDLGYTGTASIIISMAQIVLDNERTLHGVLTPAYLSKSRTSELLDLLSSSNACTTIIS